MAVVVAGRARQEQTARGTSRWRRGCHWLACWCQQRGGRAGGRGGGGKRGTKPGLRRRHGGGRWHAASRRRAPTARGRSRWLPRRGWPAAPPPPPAPMLGPRGVSRRRGASAAGCIRQAPAGGLDGRVGAVATGGGGDAAAFPRLRRLSPPSSAECGPIFPLCLSRFHHLRTLTNPPRPFLCASSSPPPPPPPSAAAITAARRCQ